MKGMQPFALVTGATGAVGPALVAELLQHGYRVRVLSRHQPASSIFSDSVEFITGDVCDRETVRAAMSDVQQVFHLAALLHITNPSPKLRAEYERVNVGATQIVAEEAARAGVQQLIYFSTVKVYGVNSAQPITEDHSVNPQTEYAITKLAGEHAALDYMATTVLRLSPIYGAHLRGSWRYLLMGIQRGLFLPVGDLKNVRSLTYVEDAARAALLVAQYPESIRQVYNLVAHDAVSMAMIFDAIYDAFGKHRPRITLPKAIIQPGATLMEMGLGLIGKRSPLTSENLAQLTQSETYSGAKLRGLGFQPQVSLEEGWQHTINAMLAKTDRNYR